MNIRLLRPVDAMRDAKVRTVIVADSPFMLKILAQTLEKSVGSTSLAAQLMCIRLFGMSRRSLPNWS